MNRYYSGIRKAPAGAFAKTGGGGGIRVFAPRIRTLGITDASGVLLQTARWAVCFTQNHLIGSNPSSSEKQKKAPLGAGNILAEEEGFEPSSPGLPVKRFSRPPHSTTLPPLRMGCNALPQGRGVVKKNGGEIGIRTLGTLLEHTRFPIVHLRPLGQLSTI